jgi:hypothetical protein
VRPGAVKDLPEAGSVDHAAPRASAAPVPWAQR